MNLPLAICRVQHHTDAAIAAAEAGNFPAAAASFRLALQLDPSSAALHEQLAQCLMELEQHDAALQAAEAATALQPDVSLLKLWQCYPALAMLMCTCCTYRRDV
jgi:tetratricopeptide (TPR) repeat protein